MSNKYFTGKSVFITGAGSGIGYETAIAFAKSGADIVATDIDQQGLDLLKVAIEGVDVRNRFELLDVTDEKAFQQLASRLSKQDSLPDIVVNNAGIAYINSFTSTSRVQWQRTLDVNVLGVVTGCRIFSKLWLKAGSAGHLVNIASGATATPMPHLSAYTATKYAVEGLCEVIAMELADSNIKVSCVHPGVINTPLAQHNEKMILPAAQLERLQRSYAEKGAHPSVVAEGIVKGVKKNKGNIFVGPGTTVAPFLKRIMPRPLYRSLLRIQAKKFGYL